MMQVAVTEGREPRVCEADGCGQSDALSRVDRLPCASRTEFWARQRGEAEGAVFLYCPYHRKHALGVSS